jgi:hypothetical protein
VPEGISGRTHEGVVLIPLTSRGHDADLDARMCAVLLTKHNEVHLRAHYNLILVVTPMCQVLKFQRPGLTCLPCVAVGKNTSGGETV